MRLRPYDPPAPSLALVAAVAVQQVAAAYSGGAAIAIKWPNDLVADGAKLAGILLERVDDAVIVGIGVNLADHPEDLPVPATDLRTLAGNAPDAEGFLEDLVDAFGAWLGRWRGEGLAPIRTRWQERAHPPGTALSVATAAGERREGLFEGLDGDGALRLRLADGRIETIRAGDVFLI